MVVPGKVGMRDVASVLLLLLLTVLVLLSNVSGHLLVMLVSGSELLVEMAEVVNLAALVLVWAPAR